MTFKFTEIELNLLIEFILKNTPRVQEVFMGGACHRFQHSRVSNIAPKSLFQSTMTFSAS